MNRQMWLRLDDSRRRRLAAIRRMHPRPRGAFLDGTTASARLAQMAEFNQNLWAPWRMEYIRSLKDETLETGCFLCRYAAHPAQDPEHHVIWRTGSCLTCFNRFPYSNGHLLIAPVAHVPSLSDLPESVLLGLMLQLRDAQRLLAATTNAHGFNVGINFGRCAGAGLPDHLHLHIVPRWEGDTNFMPVCADTRVIPQSIEALHELMRGAVADLGLPPLRGDESA